MPRPPPTAVVVARHPPHAVVLGRGVGRPAYGMRLPGRDRVLVLRPGFAKLLARRPRRVRAVTLGAGVATRRRVAPRRQAVGAKHPQFARVVVPDGERVVVPDRALTASRHMGVGPRVAGPPPARRSVGRVVAAAGGGGGADHTSDLSAVLGGGGVIRVVGSRQGVAALLEHHRFASRPIGGRVGVDDVPQFVRAGGCLEDPVAGPPVVVGPFGPAGRSAHPVVASAVVVVATGEHRRRRAGLQDGGHRRGGQQQAQAPPGGGHRRSASSRRRWRVEQDQRGCGHVAVGVVDDRVGVFGEHRPPDR